MTRDDASHNDENEQFSSREEPRKSKKRRGKKTNNNSAEEPRQSKKGRRKKTADDKPNDKSGGDAGARQEESEGPDPDDPCAPFLAAAAALTERSPSSKIDAILIDLCRALENEDLNELDADTIIRAISKRTKQTKTALQKRLKQLREKRFEWPNSPLLRVHRAKASRWATTFRRAPSIACHHLAIMEKPPPSRLR